LRVLKILVVTCFTLVLVFLTSRVNFLCSTTVKLSTIIKVSATCYYPSVNQCDSSPYRTASGGRINKLSPISHRWVAVSRDIRKRVKWGDRIFVSGTGIYDGYWEIQDVMNKRFKNKIDFLVGRNNYLSSWENVEIIIISQ
jgi:3D (Asp-Asp-Asp) domain-containing protein